MKKIIKVIESLRKPILVTDQMAMGELEFLVYKEQVKWYNKAIEDVINNLYWTTSKIKKRPLRKVYERR